MNFIQKIIFCQYLIYIAINISEKKYTDFDIIIALFISKISKYY